jgi:hypothetical protein
MWDLSLGYTDLCIEGLSPYGSGGLAVGMRRGHQAKLRGSSPNKGQEMPDPKDIVLFFFFCGTGV